MFLFDISRVCVCSGSHQHMFAVCHHCLLQLCIIHSLDLHWLLSANSCSSPVSMFVVNKASYFSTSHWVHILIQQRINCLLSASVNTLSLLCVEYTSSSSPLETSMLGPREWHIQGVSIDVMISHWSGYVYCTDEHDGRQNVDAWWIWKRPVLTLSAVKVRNIMSA
jgi:hypothetical protein